MRRIPALLSFLVALSPALAHDLWLQPESDDVDGPRILIRAVVGASFPKWEEAKQAADYRDVRVFRDGTMVALAGAGTGPTTLGSVRGDSAFFVGAVGPQRQIDLKPEEVRGYLRDEVGLRKEAIDRVLAGSGPTLHETYTRALKTLVIPRLAREVPADVAFHLPREIVLLRWERGHDPRMGLSIRLLKDGKPLPGSPVRVLSVDGSERLRTDARGEARTWVDPGAPVLVAFIELAASAKGRYETFWTNLAIFDFREPAPRP